MKGHTLLQQQIKDNITGIDYENYVAEYLKTHGFRDVKVTKASGDYGVDILAHKGNKKYAIQCKYYSKPVGLSAVQEVVAGKIMYNCDETMVITNNIFTTAAKELAKKNNVLLLSEIAPKKYNFTKKLKVTAIVFYIFIILGALLDEIEFIKELTFLNAAQHFVKLVLLLGIPVWIYFSIFLIKKILLKITVDRHINNVLKTGSPKRVFFVKGKVEGNESYSQTGEHNNVLEKSTITGLPHKFTVMGKKYDIDKIDDVKSFPLNFASFQINNQRYYFNEYFRLCAKYYREENYCELADALEEKANEIESEPLFGRHVKKNSKTIITPPSDNFKL